MQQFLKDSYIFTYIGRRHSNWSSSIFRILIGIYCFLQVKFQYIYNGIENDNFCQWHLPCKYSKCIIYSQTCLEWPLSRTTPCLQWLVLGPPKSFFSYLTLSRATTCCMWQVPTLIGWKTCLEWPPYSMLCIVNHTMPIGDNATGMRHLVRVSSGIDNRPFSSTFLYILA